MLPCEGGRSTMKSMDCGPYCGPPVGPGNQVLYLPSAHASGCRYMVALMEDLCLQQSLKDVQLLPPIQAAVLFLQAKLGCASTMLC